MQSVTFAGDSSFYSPPSSTGEKRPNHGYLLETFHQLPHGDFRPTFYNPFEIKHRRRTSRAQLKVLEKSFTEDSKPNATVRRILAQKLDMTPRGVQIWFQNRRAKAKIQRRKASKGSDDQHINSDTRPQQQHSDKHTKKNNTYPHDTAVAPRKAPDVEQPSVLFSQFFANVQTRSDKPTFTTYLPPKSQTTATSTTSPTVTCTPPEQPAWGYLPWQQQHQEQQDSVRSVATVAAAVAAAASYEQGGNSNLVHMGVPMDSNHQDWLTVPTHPLADPKDPALPRRNSCPVQCSTVMGAAVDQSQHKERRVSENDMPVCHIAKTAPGGEGWSDAADTIVAGTAGSLSPHSNLYSSVHNSSSSLIPLDLYQLQDSHLDYAPITPQYQLTPPPLAASSCSVSSGSVSGSPCISMSGACYDNAAAFECFNFSHPDMDVSHLPSSSTHIPIHAFPIA